MKKILEIFKDDNDWNEKSIVGFLAFAGIMIFAVTDLVTGIMQKELIISDTIYNSLVIITLGAFGIAEVGKIWGKKE
jgi:hypothetical protein